MTGLLYIPTTKEVWSTSADTLLCVWSTANPFACIKYISTDNYMLCLTLHKDVVWVGTETAIVLWDVKTRERLRVLKFHSKFVHALVAIDDEHVWSCSSDGQIGNFFFFFIIFILFKNNNFL